MNRAFVGKSNCNRSDPTRTYNMRGSACTAGHSLRTVAQFKSALVHQELFPHSMREDRFLKPLPAHLFLKQHSWSVRFAVTLVGIACGVGLGEYTAQWLEDKGHVWVIHVVSPHFGRNRCEIGGAERSRKSAAMIEIMRPFTYETPRPSDIN